MKPEQPVLAEILLVEDEAADVDLIRLVLKHSKIANQLHVVEDGVAALKFLRERERAKDWMPGLILLDLNLPEKSGFEVLEEIKNDPLLKRIPVAIMTSSQSEEDLLKSYNLHANCYISKPIDMGQFQKIVMAVEDFWFSIVRLPPLK